MKLSIKWVLIGGFLGLLLLSITTILASSYLTSEKILQGHAKDIMENIATLTVQESQGYLNPARSAVQLTQRLARSEVIKSEDKGLMERYFYEQLSLYPQISGIYFGNPKGEFTFVMRNNSKFEGGYRTKLITVNENSRTVELIWKDARQQEFLREFDQEDAYDPRQRPWYIDAKKNGKLIWTRPYIFYTSQKPGLTVASPVLRNEGVIHGVIGVDIEIDEISNFLSKLKVGKNGQAFILSRHGDVIAFPDMKKLRHPTGEGNTTFRLTKINELDSVLSQKAFASLERPVENFDLVKPVFTSFIHEGENYHAMFTPFESRQWPWVIGIYLPENDYLGPIKKNRLFNIYLGLGIAAFATLIGLLIARSIARPMKALQEEAHAIKSFKLGSIFQEKSFIKEIQDTTQSFSQMKIGLEESKKKNDELTEGLEKQAELLRKKELQLRASFSSLLNFSDALIVLDETHHVCFINPAAEILLKINPTNILGKPLPFETRENGKTEIKITTGSETTLTAEMSVVGIEWEGQKAQLVSLRDISEQKQAEKSLNESNRILKKTVFELAQREKQLKSISKMAEFFQVCTTEKEVMKIISQNMELLFPVDAGAVYLLDKSSRIFSCIHTWGNPGLSLNSFPPEQCWALKKDQPYVVIAEKSRLLCEHVKDELSTHDFLCLPISSHQGQLGLLHLQLKHPGLENPTESSALSANSLRELGVAAAEHIALALTNVRLQEELHALAILDPLTGLYNRRYMQEYLEQEISRAARIQGSIGIVLLDIDHFKKLNDHYGHDAGDKVLERLASVLQSQIREGDICCRYGGEEFLLILPGSGYQATMERAETLRKVVSQTQFHYEGTNLGSLTISLGVSAYPKYGNSSETLIRAADQSMYEAKVKGRNLVQGQNA